MNNQRTPELEFRDYLHAAFYGLLDDLLIAPAMCQFKDQPRSWDDRVPAVDREPCDERDDGFNKTSSVEDLPIRVLATQSGSDYFYTRVVMRYLFEARLAPGYLGITYRLGDTTTFSAGPYDESLGIPVTVHFRKD